jgi:hypothetical protein
MEQDLALENCFTCNDTVGDADLLAFSTPQNSKQMSSLQQNLSGENKDQTKLFTCEFSSNNGEIVTMRTYNNQNRFLYVMNMYVWKQK